VEIAPWWVLGTLEWLILNALKLHLKLLNVYFDRPHYDWVKLSNKSNEAQNWNLKVISSESSQAGKAIGSTVLAPFVNQCEFTIHQWEAYNCQKPL
jgi:hypothetical protein